MMPKLSSDELEIIRGKGYFFSWARDGKTWTSRGRLGKYKEHAIVFDLLADIAIHNKKEEFYLNDELYFKAGTAELAIADPDFIAVLLDRQCVAYALDPCKFILTPFHKGIGEVLRHGSGIAYAATDIKDASPGPAWEVLDDKLNKLSERQYSSIKSLGSSNGYLCFVGELPGCMSVEINSRVVLEDESIMHAEVRENILHVIGGKKWIKKDFEIGPGLALTEITKKAIKNTVNTGYVESNRLQHYPGC